MKIIKRCKLLVLALVVGAVPLLPAQMVSADSLGAVSTYPLANTSPTHIVEDANGNLWTNGKVYNSSTWTNKYYAYKVNRTSGTYTTYDAYPNITGSMAIGPDNNVWATDSFYVTKTNTTTGARSSYDPSDTYANPYWGLTPGPDGNMWFGMNGTKSVNGQTVAVDRIGRISTAGVFQSSFDIDGFLVTSLVGDNAHNVVWYGARGETNNTGVIGSITPNGTQTQYTVPLAGYSPGELTIGPDGNIWFPIAGNKVGKMTPTGSFTFYTLTPPGNLQYAAWGKDGYLWINIINKGQVARVALDGTATYYTYSTAPEGASDIVAGKDGNIWLVTTNSHQLIKIGTGFTDNDEDGLQYADEITQGTTDNNPDYDGDGLSDYTESTAYTARNSVFCDTAQTTCEYPNPIAKDIYVESDWMAKPGTNGYSMQLTSGQVQSIKDSFANKNITLHIDTGQLGGGNEVPYNTNIYYKPQSGQVDFYDYKLGGDGVTANFAPDRKDIFHYMISGDSYRDDAGQPSLSSGASYTGDDDFFVSYGYIKDSMQSAYNDFSTAISGTVQHELGHGLCLSVYNNGNPAYPGQPAECRYAGVDAHAGNAYNSVMNYDMQFYIANYSNGINGAPNDHDDWSAIRLADFNKNNIGDWQHGSANSNPTLKNQKPKQKVQSAKLNVGPTLKQLRNPQH